MHSLFEFSFHLLNSIKFSSMIWKHKHCPLNRDASNFSNELRSLQKLWKDHLTGTSNFVLFSLVSATLHGINVWLFFPCFEKIEAVDNSRITLTLICILLYVPIKFYPHIVPEKCTAFKLTYVWAMLALELTVYVLFVLQGILGPECNLPNIPEQPLFNTQNW